MHTCIFRTRIERIAYDTQRYDAGNILIARTSRGFSDYNSYFYTLIQRPLQGRRRDDDEWDPDYDSGQPHLSHLCEKCKKLGYNCRGSGY